MRIDSLICYEAQLVRSVSVILIHIGKRIVYLHFAGRRFRRGCISADHVPFGYIGLVLGRLGVDVGVSLTHPVFILYGEPLMKYTAGRCRSQASE